MNKLLEWLALLVFGIAWCIPGKPHHEAEKLFAMRRAVKAATIKNT